MLFYKFISNFNTLDMSLEDTFIAITLRFTLTWSDSMSTRQVDMPLKSVNSILYNRKYVNVSKVRSATIVEGNTRAPFSLLTTPRCKGGHIFRELLHFILDLYLIMLSVQQGGIKYHFFETLV